MENLWVMKRQDKGFQKINLTVVSWDWWQGALVGDQWYNIAGFKGFP